MSKVNVKDVALLRKQTGVGFSACSDALKQNNGDIEAAKDFLRKKGLANAEKKGGRIAAEGVIAIEVSGQQAMMLEQNCETDFVAKNEDFVQFAKQLVTEGLAADCQDVKALMAHQDFESQRQQLVLTLGENIQVRRLHLMKAKNSIEYYQHGSKIGVMIDFEGPSEVGKDIAMHVAATNPSAISIDQLPEALVKREREIAEAHTQALNKPKEIVEKILEGKLKKTLGEMCLLNQAFIKDTSQSVSQYLSEHNASVNQIIRYEVGEGIEKKQENFAEEVKKQLGD